MKQKGRLVRFAIAVWAILLAVLANWQQADSPAIEAPQPSAATAIVTPLQRHHHEATLTDASQIYRICSSRPQRIMPTQGAKTERTITPCSSQARQQHVKPLHSFFDSRYRRETAPFCLSASRDYYVIALRHIIR